MTTKVEIVQRTVSAYYDTEARKTGRKRVFIIRRADSKLLLADYIATKESAEVIAAEYARSLS